MLTYHVLRVNANVMIQNVQPGNSAVKRDQKGNLEITSNNNVLSAKAEMIVPKSLRFVCETIASVMTEFAITLILEMFAIKMGQLVLIALLKKGADPFNSAI